MPQKIIIVRHGETQYNAERRLQGWADVPLNKNGLAQAAKVATRLKDEFITTIYSSDHKRAHKTAQKIGLKHSLKPIKTQALREDRMGVFEGWQWEVELDEYKQKLWNERIAARETGDIHWKPEGGESLKEHTDRVKKFLHQIEFKHKNDTIAIVTHGGTINRIIEIYGFKNSTDEYVRFQNTSVTVLTRDKSGYHLEILNDISHIYNIQD